MKCPKCLNKNLKAKTVKNSQVELDFCEQCKGLWFDSREVNRVLGARAETHFAIPKFATLNSDIVCPRCNKGLYEFCYPGTMTLVDACKFCQGMWLDNLEWKEISEARDTRNQITCPKCSRTQQKSDGCVHCGIVFLKYNKHQLNSSQSSSLCEQTKPRPEEAGEAMPESYADDIPGIKGKLLRFIDHSIERLTNY